MRRRAIGRAGGAACGVLLAVLAAGCAQTVPGTAHAEGEGPSPTSAAAAPPSEFREPSGRPTVTVQPEETAGAPDPVVPGPLPGPATPADPAVPADEPTRTSAPRRGPGTSALPAAAPAPLTADVLADECLLDANGMAALLGGPVTAPAESAVTRPDGSRTRSCYTTTRAGNPPPTAAVNVYRVNRGTPASFVRAAAGGRALTGAGEAAVLLDTVGGTTMQVATPRLLITVSVVDGAPSDERWRAAGQAVAAAVARR